jgi:hypothetical protein
VFFTCSPRDARNLAEHTLPELDEHDLAHLDAYTTAARLLVGERQLPAFTMRTRPARPIVGAATAIRQAAADAVPAQDTSAVDEVVRMATAREKERQRRRRPPAKTSASTDATSDGKAGSKTDPGRVAGDRQPSKTAAPRQPGTSRPGSRDRSRPGSRPVPPPTSG